MTKASLQTLLLFVLVCPPTADAQEGMILYTHGSRVKGTIHLATLDGDGNVVSDEEIYAEQALDPKFSPDGNRIVFAKDEPRGIWVMDLDGSNLGFLSSCENDNYPLGSWRHSDRVYFNGGTNLLCYHFDTNETTVEMTNSQQTYRELDISTNLRGVHGGMPPIWAFDLSLDTDVHAFDLCGGSISPDGTRVTNCHADHQGFNLRAWGDWNIVDSISTPTQYEALNPQYSGNSNNHILMNIKNASDEYQTWLYEISTDRWFQVTDDIVANGVSDFFLGLPEPPDPLLTLSDDSLSFAAVAGEANPDSRTVSLSNTGGGTLNSVTTELHYLDGDGWLDVSVSGSGNDQVLTNAVDTTGLEAGDYRATVDVLCGNAPNSPQAYEVLLSLAPWSPALKRINCGTNTYTPAGWENDDSYVSGGSDHDFDGTWDLSAEHAAPEAIYQTVRHLDHDYNIADLADGRYTVRFHMGDGSATDARKMDFFIEDVQVLDDFSPGMEAGAGLTALVRDFSVTIADGDGLQIQARTDTGNDVFLCGLEVLEATGPENQPPVVNAGNDQIVTLASGALLFGIVEDDGLPGPFTVTWTVLSGPGEVVFDNDASTSTNASFSMIGDYDLRLTADDGELEAHDEVRITVTDAPAIVLLSPTGGEEWQAGTEQTIRWSTVHVDDVVPYYSIDDGATWTRIENFIYEPEHPDWWGHYPWTVPDDPSEQCRVRIEEYNNSQLFAMSGNTFTILPLSELECPEGTVEQNGKCVEANDLQGACGCGRASDGASPVVILAGLFLLFARRRKGGSL